MPLLYDKTLKIGDYVTPTDKYKTHFRYKEYHSFISNDVFQIDISWLKKTTITYAVSKVL